MQTSKSVQACVISKTSRHDEIIIKKLTTKGHNSAFSIGVPPKIFDVIWPDSVCLREFNVRSFLEKKRHIQNN
jgi:hypothetical protein